MLLELPPPLRFPLCLCYPFINYKEILAFLWYYFLISYLFSCYLLFICSNSGNKYNLWYNDCCYFCNFWQLFNGLNSIVGETDNMIIPVSNISLGVIQSCGILLWSIFWEKASFFLAVVRSAVGFLFFLYYLML